MKKIVLIMAVTLAFVAAKGQEVNVGGGAMTIFPIDNKGAVVEISYSHQIIPHLYAMGRFASYDAVGPKVPYSDNAYIETNTLIGKMLQVGPMVGWTVANRFDFRLALLAGVDYRSMSTIIDHPYVASNGTTGTTWSTITMYETDFRWDIYASASWWFTERMGVGLYGSSQMPRVYDKNGKHFGLLFSIKL